MAVANEYQGKPICFIAVNSGNDARSVNRYLASNKVSWPTIVDSNRQFEKSVMDNEISLSNIWRNFSIDGEGQIKTVFASKKSDIKKEIDALLETASWNVEPGSVPAGLKQAWVAIEFGNYSAAAKVVQKGLKSRDEELKSGAETLNDFVQQQLEPLATAAAEHLENEEPWKAYKAYLDLQANFNGYFDESLNIKKVLSELKSNKTVKLQIAAMKQLENASVLAARSGFEKVRGRLKKLVEKFPDTEAAKTAQHLLQENPEP